MGGIGIWQLIIVAVIVILLFGTKKLRNLGGDLGSAIKGFKNAVGDDDSKATTKETSETLTDSSSENSTAQKSATDGVKSKENNQA